MDIKKYPKNQSAYLRNYSQVSSLGRLSDPDSEFSSELTAGGDNNFKNKHRNK